MAVLRWYKRLKIVYNPNVGNASTDENRDDVCAFFIACFHLQDYLKKDADFTLQNKHQIIDGLVSSPELNIAESFCNSTKHLILHDPTLDKNIKISRIDCTVVASLYEPITSSNSFIINSRGQYYDALELAKKCCLMWKDFMNLHLIPSEISRVGLDSREVKELEAELS